MRAKAKKEILWCVQVFWTVHAARENMALCLTIPRFMRAASWVLGLLLHAFQ